MHHMSVTNTNPSFKPKNPKRYLSIYLSQTVVQSQGVLSKGDSIIFHLQNN